MKIIRKQAENERVSGVAKSDPPPFAWIHNGVCHVRFGDLDNPNTTTKYRANAYEVHIDQADLEHIVQAARKAEWKIP